MDGDNKFHPEFPRCRFGQDQGNSIPVHDRLNFNRARENSSNEKGGGGVEGSRAGFQSKDSDICFWCRQEGHHQATCTNPPYCFRCKENGHLGSNCPSNQHCSMHMFGFGIPGQGFHSLKIPGSPRSNRLNSLEQFRSRVEMLTQKSWRRN